MYFDNLTVISLIIFAIALGSFVYACLIRGCLTAGGTSARSDQNQPVQRDRDEHNQGSGD